MNRRNFLKSLTAACGAAVVCPGELLKSPVTFKGFPTFAEQPYMKWKNYYADYKPPVSKDTKLIITQGRQGRSGWVMFREIPVYYQENLSA